MNRTKSSWFQKTARVGKGLLAVVLPAVLAAGGCDYRLEQLGGKEGTSPVFVAAGRKGAPNAGIICTSQGAVVVDPPLNMTLGNTLRRDAFAKSAAFWSAKYAKRRPPTRFPPVLYVFNTTWRGSHSFGNISFAAHPTAKPDIISTPAARRRLTSEAQEMREELSSRFHVPDVERVPIAPANVLVDGTMVLVTDEVRIEFRAVGDCVGEGDAVVWLPGQRTLFAGDLVLVGYVPYYKGRTRTVRHWIAVLRELEKLDVAHVVPGHGPVGGKELLTRQRRFLETLVAATEKALQAGKSKAEAARSVQLADYRTWVKYAEWLPQNVALVYEELAAAAAQKRTSAKPAARSERTAARFGATMVSPMIERPDLYRRE